jgi:filamentous hemagglutinin family protein
MCHKKLSFRHRHRHRALVLALAGSLGGVAGGALALPQGGVVAAGAASIATQGSAMTITQATNSATYNWQSFNIGKTEAVHFQQPSATSVALNYVLGNGNSIIDGSLTSNGQLFLSNPNGILFGATAQVNVAGLTLDAGTGQLNNAGHLNVNGGTLTASAGIINNTGLIEATRATAVGGKIVLTAGTAVVNTGSINANGISGGSILLNAGTSVLQMGQVQANGTAGLGGNIALNAGYRILQTAGASTDASGIAGGTIGYRTGATGADSGLMISGAINANGTSGKGGTLVLTGANVELLAARLDATGTTAGGNISIGGGFQGKDATIANAQKTSINAATTINASATQGDGGNVVVWSDQQTSFSGNIDATGV